jgi:hypothetical protein
MLETSQPGKIIVEGWLEGISFIDGANGEACSKAIDCGESSSWRALGLIVEPGPKGRPSKSNSVLKAVAGRAWSQRTSGSTALSNQAG